MAKDTIAKIIQSGDFTMEGRLAIRRIANSREVFAVYRLANDYYQSKGIRNPHPDGLWVSRPEFDHYPKTTILVAMLNEEVVGSVSITLDGEKGLTVDRQFNQTCRLIRTEGRRLAELWRLVVSNCKEQTLISIALLKAAMELLAKEGVQTCLFSFHPDFVELCQRLFNVVTLVGGQFITGAGFISLPTVLMRCQLEKHAGPLALEDKAANE